MALITCPECNTEVSDKAEACPKCAYPLAGGGTTQAHGGKVQTVEQTSKKYKLHQLLSILLIITSFIIMFASTKADDPSPLLAVGVIGLIIGVLWYAINRFRTWWHHA